jgi:hypothetical protein
MRKFIGLAPAAGKPFHHRPSPIHPQNGTIMYCNKVEIDSNDPV